MNKNLMCEIHMNMKVKYILFITETKDEVLWKRLLYRDFKNKCDKNCYKEYKSIITLLNKLNQHHIFF